MTMKAQCDFLIIGAGIVGLGIARSLKIAKPDLRITIIDKEVDVALHASGRNSGVLHAGIYYSSSSLKAKLCLRGNYLLRDLCREKNIPVFECGKLIVATKEEELLELSKLHQKAIANGCTIEKISEDEARKIEPNVHCYGEALFSPLTASVNPVAICHAIKDELEKWGVSFLFNTKFEGRSGNTVITNCGVIEAGHVVNTGGLFADRIAKSYGVGQKYGILPFKGIYLKYTKDKDAVRTNVYPVPDPQFPFLGVHFTKTYDGTIKIGPTAIPALWREQYGMFENFSLRDLLEIGTRETKLFLTNAFHFRDLAFEEVKRYNRNYFINEAAKLVHSFDKEAFVSYPKAGIRAQLLDLTTGELVQDFVIEKTAESTHILNAVSPGFTCGLSFGEHVVNEIFGEAHHPSRQLSCG